MPEDAEHPAGQRSTVVLLTLGLIWLAAYLWAAHASIVGAGQDELIAVFDAALALPGVVAATMLAGATAGVTALGWVRPRLSTPGGWAASVIALVSGLVIGGLASGMILLGYGHRSSIMVLAWAVLAAGAVGGIIGSVRPREMISAGLAATIVAFLLGFVLNYKQDALLDLFGAGNSVQSRADALNRLTPTESLLAGVLAGIVAFLYLRRSGTGLQFWPRFLAHLAGGATPGIILLLAEVVTRLGGGQLFGAAGSDSAIDQAAIAYSSGSRLNHGLIVLFTGAFVALIAFGVTVRPATAVPAEPAGRRGANRRGTATRPEGTAGSGTDTRSAPAADSHTASTSGASGTKTDRDATGHGGRKTAPAARKAEPDAIDDAAELAAAPRGTSAPADEA
ncbi:hypothetical protein [Rugosimonospora africana]|uniref:Uncharacterized protein n=1 Tax=Rugosimonospora africana TaxID=556532 RepID=A0A8J3QJZ8_9ACTN|nr:hypothetical protein [Rugosimonospora africana]GIH11986.1 hypothetical protein Raf01_01580 [Rugosimonospora africana]